MQTMLFDDLNINTLIKVAKLAGLHENRGTRHIFVEPLTMTRQAILRINLEEMGYAGARQEEGEWVLVKMSSLR